MPKQQQKNELISLLRGRARRSEPGLTCALPPRKKDARYCGRRQMAVDPQAPVSFRVRFLAADIDTLEVLFGGLAVEKEQR